MKLRGRCKFHCTATAFIFLLGTVRGIGGIIDLINNTEKLIEINTSSATLILLTIFLILLSPQHLLQHLVFMSKIKTLCYLALYSLPYL